MRKQRPTRDDAMRAIARYALPEPNTGCWLWSGAVAREGRPIMCHEGRLYLVGRILLGLPESKCLPGDIFALHRCDTPECVNPDHLFPGTQAENMQDMIRKGRKPVPVGYSRKTHCVNGHEFTPENTKIKVRRETGRNRRACRECDRIGDRRRRMANTI